MEQHVMILALALSSAFASDIDPATLDALARQQAEIQDLQAERDALAARCARTCKPAASTHKSTAPKPAPKSTAPKPAAAPAPVVPDVEIAELREEIAELRERLDSPPAITVNITLPSAPPAPVNETEEASETPDVVSDSRAQIGVGETIIFAAPINSSESWVTEDTALNVRYSWKLPGKNGKNNPFWFALDGSGGYSFLDHGSVLQVMPELLVTAGDMDFFIGAGARGVCNDVFGGNLCSRTRIGGQVAVGFDQHLAGPLGVQVKALIGYEVDDDQFAGPGGRLYGGASLQFFFGEIGEVTWTTVD